MTDAVSYVQDGPYGGYAYLRKGTVARTVQVTDSLLVDLDADDRILGVECLSKDVIWQDALITLAMVGRLAVPDRQVIPRFSEVAEVKWQA